MLRGQMESNKIQCYPITICFHQVSRKTPSWLVEMLPRRCYFSFPEEKSRATVTAAVTDREMPLDLPWNCPSSTPAMPRSGPNSALALFGPQKVSGSPWAGEHYPG